MIANFLMCICELIFVPFLLNVMRNAYIEKIQYIGLAANMKGIKGKYDFFSVVSLQKNYHVHT